MTTSTQESFNTSSLTLTRIAEEMERQERLQGSTIAYINAFKVSHMIKGSKFPIVHPNKGSSRHFHTIEEIERRRLLANPSEMEAATKLAASVSALVRIHTSTALKSSSANTSISKCTRSFEERERDRRLSDVSGSDVRRTNAHLVSELVKLNGSSVRARLIKRKNITAEIRKAAPKSPRARNMSPHIAASTRLHSASPELLKVIHNKHQRQLAFRSFCPVFIGPEPLVSAITAKEPLPPTPAAPALHAHHCSAPPSPFALSPCVSVPTFASPAICVPTFHSPAMSSVPTSPTSKGNKVQKRQRVRAAVSKLRTHLHQQTASKLGKNNINDSINNINSCNNSNNINILKTSSPRVQSMGDNKSPLSGNKSPLSTNKSPLSAAKSPTMTTSDNNSDWRYRVKGLPTPLPLSPAARRSSPSS